MKFFLRALLVGFHNILCPTVYYLHDNSSCVPSSVKLLSGSKWGHINVSSAVGTEVWISCITLINFSNTCAANISSIVSYKNFLVYTMCQSVSGVHFPLVFLYHLIVQRVKQRVQHTLLINSSIILNNSLKFSNTHIATVLLNFGYSRAIYHYGGLGAL